ncbi:hypothetical protein U5903_03390 [Cereibacter johrii]|uniref:hypothetical protein n=1 Tax=Cereibacter johrii TaxID=445629 RepID=UPI002B25DEC0|nr:hypothetical protein [Cereibacter johrii]MEA5159810.1 hypothetical protein [Cereibacter johrii]
MAFDFLPRASGAYASITRWLSSHGSAAAQAATLLAGEAAGVAVLSLIDDLRRTGRLQRRHHLQLVKLHRVLTLDAPELPEEDDIPYLPIHPDDPRVHDICRLADSLSDLLSEISVQAKAA